MYNRKNPYIIGVIGVIASAIALALGMRAAGAVIAFCSLLLITGCQFPTYLPDSRTITRTGGFATLSALVLNGVIAAIVVALASLLTWILVVRKYKQNDQSRHAIEEHRQPRARGDYK